MAAVDGGMEGEVEEGWGCWTVAFSGPDKSKEGAAGD